MKLRVVPMTAIAVFDDMNVSRGGRAIVESSVRSLAEDIGAHGLLEELGVTSIEQAEWLTEDDRAKLANNGKSYVLVYGFRRFKACSMLGFESVRCADLGPITRANAELANIAENWSREAPNEYDLAIACHRFVSFHKVTPATIAQRTGKSLRFVEESVRIVGMVAPDLLQHYRANCGRDMRRKMLALAAIEGHSDEHRHGEQRNAWASMLEQEATERRNDPNADFRPRGTRKRVVSGNSGASKREIMEMSNSLHTAREILCGSQWVPIEKADPRIVAQSMLAWTLNPDMQLIR